MAKQFLVPVDLNKNELRNAVVQVLAADPASPVEGQVYYNSVSKRQRTYNGTTWIDDTDRANHSGTQTAATISDFDTQVRTNRLDQLATPTADVSLGTKKITNLATPTLGTDAATKAYVDASASGLDVKASVRVASTANVTVASPGATIDTITMVVNDRVLLKNQSTGSENGIYVWNGAAVPMTRATDADTSAEVTSGMFTFVSEGSTANAKSGWLLTTSDPIVLGTTALVFAQFSGAGTYTAGAGLTSTGTTFDVGQGAGIIVNPNDVAIDTTVVVRKFAQAIVGGSASEVITHGLGTQDVTVALYLASGTFEERECDIQHTSTNTITLLFATAPTSGQYRVVIHG